jgi:hypothetical protein
VEKADRKRGQWRPRPVLVRVARLVRVTVKVGVPKPTRMLVHVDVEETRSPLPEESERECHDDQSDRSFDYPPEGLGQRGADEQDGQAESDERDGMPEAPREPEQGACPGAPPVRPGHEDRDGSEVIRVGGVAEPQEQGDEEDDGGPTAFRELRDRAVH